MSDDGFNFTELLLQGAERLLVWASDSSDFEGISPIQELLGPVGQLADDHVPEGEALVARHAVREEARVAPGALVAAWPFHPFIADALPGGTVTLRGLDATRVAVTGWKEKKARVKATVREMMLTLAGRKKKKSTSYYEEGTYRSVPGLDYNQLITDVSAWLREPELSVEGERDKAITPVETRICTSQKRAQ